MEIVESTVNDNGRFDVTVVARRGEAVTLPHIPLGRVTIVTDNTSNRLQNEAV